MLGLPATCGGGFVTGTTAANFSALAAARGALLSRSGWNVEERGLFDAPPIRVIVGDEVHVSVLKALQMLGLGRTRVTKIATDGQGRMKADQLPQLDENTIVCIQAGNVHSGAFDPAAEICLRARSGIVGTRRWRLRALGRRVSQLRASGREPERLRRNAEQTNQVIDDVQNDGTCWCGGTQWHGKTAMRISVSCWATSDADVKRSVEAIVSLARSS